MSTEFVKWRMKRHGVYRHRCDGCGARIKDWDSSSHLFLKNANTLEACEKCDAKIVKALKPLGFKPRYFKKGE